MKRSYRRVLDCLQSSGTVWWPSGAGRGWLVYYDDGKGVDGEVGEVRVSTLKEMERLGLVEFEVNGEMHPDGCDTYAKLAIGGRTTGRPQATQSPAVSGRLTVGRHLRGGRDG